MPTEHIIFSAIVGSTAYGTNTPASDIDYKSIYVQPIDKIIGFGYKPQYEVGRDNACYEVRRFLELLSKANPTMLELLFMPEDCIIGKSPVFDLILAEKHKFLTKKCLHSFGGYAVEQIQKAKGLAKKMNWEKEKTVRKDVLDFCYVLDDEKEGTVPVKMWLKREGFKQEHCGLAKLNHFKDTYNLYYDHLADMQGTSPRFGGQNRSFNGIVSNIETSNDVNVSSIPEYLHRSTVMYFNKDGYSMHCKDYREYQQWIKERNTARYVDTSVHGQKIDGKNLLHCRRLLDMAEEIATQKTLLVRRPNADYLLDIRKGNVPLDPIIEKAEEDINKLNTLFQESDLPEEVDPEFLNKLLIKIRRNYEL